MADKIEKLSQSDFGFRVAVSKSSEGKFRSFGINYKGDTVWVNDETLYNEWVARNIAPETITLERTQRMTYDYEDELDEKGVPTGRKTDVRKLDNRQRPTLVPAVNSKGEPEMVWSLTEIKTITQLENESALRVRVKTLRTKEKTMELESLEKYYAVAQKAASVAKLSTEQEAELERMLEGAFK